MLRTAATNNISRMPVILPAGDQPTRMFETVTSSVLAIAAQALVVGVVITTF